MQTLTLSGKSACFRLKTVLLPLCMLAVMMLATQVMAATITVNSTLDTTGNVSICTLRDAITAANTDTATGGCVAGSGDDTITFAASLSGQTITLTSTLNLSSNITIDGSGLTSHVKISGNNAVTVFSIAAGITVILNHLGIINGKSISGSGGIYNQGTLTVSNSTFSGNLARGGSGIWNHAGTLTVINSIFSGNSTLIGDGGGIYNDNGILTVSNSAFSGNSANSGGWGGGICNNAGSLIVINSTFSGNSANRGGGICNLNTGTASIYNSTIYGNTATYGGGISIWGGTVNIYSTIVAGSGTGKDFNGIINTLDHSLYEDKGTATITTDTANQIGNPNLAPLADNGGSTQTFALLAGSPAINTGDPATCTTTDQRGYARVGTCDIGAFEYGAVLPAPSGLNANAASQTQIDLSWTDNSSGTAVFKIYRGITMLTTTAAGLTSYSDTGLVCGTTYNYEVIATNSDGDSAATTPASATTLACVSPVTAGVSMVSVSNVKSTTALVTGTASGAGIGERGFFWWSDEIYWGDNASGLLPAGYGAGDFSLNLSLPMLTQLYVRAYIKVGGQLITSDNKISITTTGPVPPTVITGPGFTVSGNSVLANGEITDVGSSAVTIYGFVYAKHESPTVWDSALPFSWDLTLPISTGKAFEGTIKNLAAGKYYFRSYAHNTQGTAYGEEFSFTIGSDIPGDLNGDWKVDLADVIIALKILDNLPVANLNLKADVNGDGKIGHEEAIFVLQKVSMLR